MAGGVEQGWAGALYELNQIGYTVLIIKKPYHFGEVSYKRRRWPKKRPV
jgi:hypothetical protein